MTAQQYPIIISVSTFIIDIKEPHTPSIKVTLPNNSKLIEVLRKITALMPNNRQIYAQSNSYLQFYHAIPYQPQSEVPIIQEFSRFRHQYNTQKNREEIKFRIDKNITVGKLQKILNQLSGSMILQIRWKSIFTLIHSQIQMGCFILGEDFKPQWNLKQIYLHMASKSLANQHTEHCDKSVFEEVRENIQDYSFFIENSQYDPNTQLYSIKNIFSKHHTYRIHLNLIYKKSKGLFTGN